MEQEFTEAKTATEEATDAAGLPWEESDTDTTAEQEGTGTTAPTCRARPHDSTSAEGTHRAITFTVSTTHDSELGFSSGSTPADEDQTGSMWPKLTGRLRRTGSSMSRCSVSGTTRDTRQSTGGSIRSEWVLLLMIGGYTESDRHWGLDIGRH